MKKKLTNKNVSQAIVDKLKKKIATLESQNDVLKLELDNVKADALSLADVALKSLEQGTWRQEAKEELKDSGYGNLVDPQPQPKKPWWKRLF